MNSCQNQTQPIEMLNFGGGLCETFVNGQPLVSMMKTSTLACMWCKLYYNDM
jgi:hypothetical protein